MPMGGGLPPMEMCLPTRKCLPTRACLPTVGCAYERGLPSRGSAYWGSVY